MLDLDRPEKALHFHPLPDPGGLVDLDLGHLMQERRSSGQQQPQGTAPLISLVLLWDQTEAQVRDEITDRADERPSTDVERLVPAEAVVVVQDYTEGEETREDLRESPGHRPGVGCQPRRG